MNFTRRRVLVVDDDVDSAELAAEILRTLGGFSVRVAFNADNALAVAIAFVPQVALLDLGLPGKDGFHLLTSLRAQPSLAACRFVAITGYVGEVMKRRARVAGFARVLLKPTTTHALLTAIGARSTT